MPASVLQRFCFAMLFAVTTCPAICAPGPEPGGTMPLTVDDSGRYEAAVMLNGKGPFRFTVDTASSSSVLSRKIADRLQLQAKGSLQLYAGNGHGSAEFASVEDYRAGVFDRHDERMAIAPNLSADGILGMNAFSANRIEFDRAKSQLTVGPSGPAPAGYAVAQGALRFNSLIVVDVVVDGVNAKAVIDTAAPFNVGNPELQAALHLPEGDIRLSGAETLNDSLALGRQALKATLDTLAVGGVVFSRPEMRFADMPVFHTLGLGDEPAMILGIGQFSHLQALAIDYPRAELQLLH